VATVTTVAQATVVMASHPFITLSSTLHSPLSPSLSLSLSRQGFAFVEFTNHQDATRAIVEKSGMVVGSRMVKVWGTLSVVVLVAVVVVWFVVVCCCCCCQNSNPSPRRSANGVSILREARGRTTPVARITWEAVRI